MSSRKLAIATLAAAVAGVTTAPVHAGSDTTPMSDDLEIACDAWFQRVGVRQSLGLALAFGENPDVGAWFADEILPLTLQVAEHVPGELADEAAIVVIGLAAPISAVLDAATEAAAADPTAGVRVLAEALRQGEPVATGLGYRVMPVYSLPAGPGDSVITGGTFEPGEYALLCAFGQGTTAADLIIPRLLGALTDPDVHTHADLGMLHVFIVE